MNLRIGLCLSRPFIILMLVNLAVCAQSTSVSPEAKGYVVAASTKNSDEKIARLEQFIVDYPKSNFLSQVYKELLNTLISSHQENNGKLLEYINKTTDKAHDSQKLSVFKNTIESLLAADLLLDEAEKLAKKALSMRGLMSSGEYEAQYMASFQALLGRVYFKQGKLKEAEGIFKKALGWSKQNSDALKGLGAICEKNGNEQQALDYYLTAAAFSRVSSEDRVQLETLYAKYNSGKVDDLDKAVIEIYKKLFPLPFKVAKYNSSKKRSTFTAVAEVFTGSGCSPCVGIDVAFDGLLQRYLRDELIVLMYHQHIPRPDPMTNPATEARGDLYDISSVPVYFIDGIYNRGGGDRDRSGIYYDDLKSIVDRLLTKEPGANLTLDITKNASIIKSKVIVSSIKSQSKNLRLQIALVEDEVDYLGENGVKFHPMVVRSLGGDKYTGFKVELSDDQTFEWEFDVDEINSETRTFLSKKYGRKSTLFQTENRVDELNTSKLTVVAFVQDVKNGKVLQAISMKVK